MQFIEASPAWVHMLGNAWEHYSFVSLVYSSMHLVHSQLMRLNFQGNEQQLTVDRL